MNSESTQSELIIICLLFAINHHLSSTDQPDRVDWNKPHLYTRGDHSSPKYSFCFRTDNKIMVFDYSFGIYGSQSSVLNFFEKTHIHGCNNGMTIQQNVFNVLLKKSFLICSISSSKCFNDTGYL